MIIVNSYGLTNSSTNRLMYNLLCKYAILNLSNSYIPAKLKYFSSANYDVLANLYYFLGICLPLELATRRNTEADAVPLQSTINYSTVGIDNSHRQPGRQPKRGFTKFTQDVQIYHK